MSRNTAESPSQQVSAANLTESERHRLLSSERRRVVLGVLDEQPAQLELQELAAEVANREDGVDAEDLETLKRVEITLHHNHLPRMDELGVVTYEPDSAQISQ